MLTRPRILLAESLDADADARLTAAADVIRAPRGDEATLQSLIGDADALIARTHTRVTRELLQAGRHLRAVGVAGVGVERVDLDAARELNITVLSTPAAASDAVAELTIGLILNLLRPIPRLAAEYSAGMYADARRAPHGDELRQLTVGIIGMGRIGSRVARMCAAGFEARVLYNDIADVGPFSFPATRVEKADIWRECDVISLHVPLTPLTRGMLDAAVLGELRPGVLLINTCRGAVVDTGALVAALQGGRLGGAALDVTEPEPLPPNHPLFALQNCILTPHIAARTHGGLRRMFEIVDVVLAFLKKA